jgi:leukotriene-A4 hydrolase
MTTQQFLADFREHVVRGDAALETRLKLDEWAYEPGIPSNAQEPSATGFVAVEQAVAAFNANGAMPAAWSSWNTMQRQRFIQTLPRRLPRRRLDALQRGLDLNTIGNMEVRFDWFALAIPNGYEPAGPAIEQFLLEQGRGKFIRPTYTALMAQGAWGQALARRVYARARPMYHPIVQTGVDRIMNPPA